MNIEAFAKYKLRRIYRFIHPKRIANYKLVKQYVKDKRGLEIGGPSKIFNDIIKIYTVAKQVDGCNFSTNTIWEGSIAQGNKFAYNDHTVGIQFINDATALISIDSNEYDFLISSHCLEHVANPIKALKEWNRVLREDGFMVLVIPNPEFMFDHKRKRTSFEHILSDYQNQVDESDMTHLQDVIDNCDLQRAYVLNGNGSTLSMEEHIKISSDNPNLRAMHHHVYSDEVVKKIVEYSRFRLLVTEHFPPFHMIYLCTKAS